MRIRKLTALAITSIIFSSCEFKCQLGDTGKKEEKKEVIEKPTEKQSPQLLNGIELNTHDVQVYRASLSLESVDLLPSNNTVVLGEKISLILNIAKGWTEIDGKSFIGASEKITTDNGSVILDSDDLFAAYNQGMNATDAKVITLKARITKAPAIPVDYYIVNFKVWDKKGSGVISGKYKFYIK